MKKRILSFALVLSLVLSLCPALVLATETEEYPVSGQCGENLTWNLDLETGALTISGTDDMYDINPYYESFGWCKHLFKIKTVELPEGLTSIGDGMLGMSYVESIDIPSTVTKIGSFAFHGCGEMTEITIPDGVIEIEEMAFSGSGLKRVEIPGSVKIIGRQAFDCRASEVILNEGLVSIGYMAFHDC